MFPEITGSWESKVKKRPALNVSSTILQGGGLDGTKVEEGKSPPCSLALLIHCLLTEHGLKLFTLLVKGNLLCFSYLSQRENVTHCQKFKYGLEKGNK